MVSVFQANQPESVKGKEVLTWWFQPMKTDLAPDSFLLLEDDLMLQERCFEKDSGEADEL